MCCYDYPIEISVACTVDEDQVSPDDDHNLSCEEEVLMGVLSIGRPLDYNEIVCVRSKLKEDALNDLISILKKHEERKKDPFLWGDEIEYTLVRFDHQNKRVQLLLKAHQILSKVNQNQNEILYHPEDCNFVIEGIPSKPYNAFINNYYQIELNMKLRREEVNGMLDKDEYLITLSLFPRLGCVECSYPSYKSDPLNSFENSICCPNQFKSPNHPRTMSLNANVNERRQSKVSVNVPIYKDIQTSKPFRDDLSCYGVADWNKYINEMEDDHIHLDSSSIGWGCCCLQVTFQSSSFDESIVLYDQLIPLTPILLCLSVSCPIWRGYLSNVDSRWNILSKTTDDRTKDEIKEKKILTSRYSCVSSYLSNESEIYNDLSIDYDKDVYHKLIENDCPSTLAKHFAHLFIRDPLYVTDQQIDENSKEKYCFENQNSMVWNCLRYKPPPSIDDNSLGWRIEFRPMELQMSDFENAALSVFLCLLSRSILSFGIDLRMKISLVHINMERAQLIDSIKQTKFHFRKNLFHFDQNETCEMTMDEIINGSKDFIGLKSLVNYYLNSFEDIHLSTRLMFDRYIQFISQRAQGKDLTNAMWMRQFVANHPLYNKDSIVNEQIQYDLLWSIKQIEDDPIQTSFYTKISQIKY